MKFRIAYGNTMTFTRLPGLKTLAEGAEAAGFESHWTVEHVIYPDGYESTYPYDPSGKCPRPAVLEDDPKGAVQELAAQRVDRVIVPSFLFLRDTTNALAEFAAKVDS